jgi:hypothetical protein
VENTKLEKTYRSLIRAIYHEDIDVIIKIVHKDGFGGSDLRIPKADIITELQNKDGDLRSALRSPVDEFSLELCKKSGEIAVSPTAFYARYKEDYKVVITELVVDKYYQVVAQGEPGAQGCRYLISGYFFIKDEDGKYYLASDIMP